MPDSPVMVHASWMLTNQAFLERFLQQMMPTLSARVVYLTNVGSGS
jgi:hypothetical protein